MKKITSVKNLHNPKMYFETHKDFPASIIDNCILSFSQPVPSPSKLLVYDPSIMKEFLRENSDIPGMSFLAIALSFKSVVNEPNSKNNLFLGIRKLYGIGFFSNQFIRNRQIEYIEQIPTCLRFIISSFINDEHFVSSVSSAIGYFASMISGKMKEISFFKPENFVYMEILSLILQFCRLPRILPNDTLQLFQEYFLCSLFCFSNEIAYTDIFMQIIIPLMNSAIVSIRNHAPTSFNIVGLVDHLLSFLKPNLDVPLKIQMLCFNILSHIGNEYPITLTFIFDFDNLQILTTFICNLVNKSIFSIGPECSIMKKYKIDITNVSLPPNTILSPPLFENTIPILMDSERKFSLPNINFDTFFAPIQFGPELDDILVHIFRLCQNASFQPMPLNHITIIRNVLQKFDNIYPTHFLVFLAKWVSKFMISEVELSLSILQNEGILKLFVRSGIIDRKCQLLVDFVGVLFPYLLTKGTSDITFIEIVFDSLFLCIQELTLEKSVLNAVLSCIFVDDSICSICLKKNNYDKRISESLINLQKMHYISNSDLELREIVINNRLLLFRFLDIIISFNWIRNYLFSSPSYVSAVAQMIFEVNVCSWSFVQLRFLLSSLKVNQPNLSVILRLFQNEFIEAMNKQGDYVTLARSLLITIKHSVSHNPSELAAAFLRHSLIDTIIKFVQFSSQPDDVNTLLEIFRVFSRVKGEMKVYISNADIFSKLLPIVQPFFKESLHNELLSILWHIVYETKDYESKKCEIRNALPISLLFYLIEPFKDSFSQFIKGILDSCEIYPSSSLEICQSDFPGHLLGYIEKYRAESKVDQIFNEVVDLFALLSGHTIKGRDLKRLFQTLTPAPGNFRPCFTLDFLRSLMFLFQNPYESPTSMFQIKSNQDAPSYALSCNCNNLVFNEFSFFIDISFSKFEKNEGTLFYIQTSDSHIIHIGLIQNEIFVRLHSSSKLIEKVFDYQFLVNTWTKIVIVYSKTTISLFVHGREQCKHSIPKQTFKGSIIKGLLMNRIDCSVGLFGFLLEAMNYNVVKQYSQFPRSVFTTFKPSEAYDFSTEFNILFQGNLIKSDLLFYDAAVTNGGTPVNLAGDYRTTPFRMEARIFGLSPRAKEMMYSVGGTKVLLPLFEQLDQPVIPENGKHVDYSIEPIYLPLLLEILSNVLRDSYQNQKDFADHNGFAILGYLLSRIRIQHLTEQVIGLLKRLFNMIDYLPLAQQMIESIFLNIKLWIYLPGELQIKVYSLVSEFFERSNKEKKEWFAEIIPYYNVLYLMKVGLWSESKNKDYQLFDQPKKSLVTREIEAKRPDDVKLIRKQLWSLANQIASIRFTDDDAKALCVFSFDLDDPLLTIDVLTSLLSLLKERNPTLMRVIQTEFPFKTFFSLLISQNDRIRSQCLHIFIIFSEIFPQNQNFFLDPFSIQEWIHGFVTTICTSNTTKLFVDIVFGYMYGLFDVSRIDLMPSLRVSQSNPKTGFQIVRPFLMPLAIQCLCSLSHNDASIYFSSLEESLSISPSISMDDQVDHPFIQYLIHVLPYQNSIVGESSKSCIRCLTRVYSNNPGLMIAIPMFIHLFCSRTRNDYTHILRLVFYDFLDNVLFNNPTQMSSKIQYEIYQMIFDFVFLIPDSDLYCCPVFEGSQTINTDNIATYQMIHQIKLNGDLPKLAFHYSTRTNSNLYWQDANLCRKFLSCLGKNPSLFCQRPSVSIPKKQLHPLFMYGFILSIGVSHSFYYSEFRQFIRPLLSQINHQGHLKDATKDAFICLMAGLTKAALTSSCDHSCYADISDLIKQYSSIINVEFETKSLSNLEPSEIGQVLRNNNGFFYFHSCLEQFSKLEDQLCLKANKSTKSTGKALLLLAQANEKYSSHFAELNIFESSSLLSEKGQQIHFQLLEFAFRVKNQMSQAGKLYRKTWRSLSSENGPWSQPKSHTVARFKIDKEMQNNYRRGRMCLNYKYSDHKDASIKRDEGNAENANEKLLQHLKKLALTEFDGDKSVVSLGGAEVDEQKVESRTSDVDGVVLKVDAKLITMKKVFSGTILMTKKFLIFEGSHSSSKYFKMILEDIDSIFHRKYLLINNALEIFTKKQKTVFFAFVDFDQRNEFLKAIKKLKLQTASFIQYTDNDIIPLINNSQKQWINGEKSTFDYLMDLNIFSGRTYHDLSQYPVFPWVIADYSSKFLDLQNPISYRDLRKPIGTLDETRFNLLKERMLYESSPETRFLYSSFYSSSAVVIGYLIRMEPFTSLHIELQSGRFDHSERLFNSIPNAWSSVHTTPMDFRELIPEFYYLPEFLENSNCFDLGKNSGSNGNVELPPWALSPTDFIIKNRAALESPIVSATITNWIDLIFGFSSRGIESENANNFFAPSFFPESITPSIMADKDRLKFSQEYAACFGQAPSQIFSKPHPQRKSYPKILSQNSFRLVELAKLSEPIIALDISNNYIFSLSRFHTIYKGKIQWDPVSLKEVWVKKIPQFTSANVVGALKSGYSVTSDSYDCCFMISSLGNMPVVLHTKRLHTKPITCIIASEKYYVTGSQDNCVVIWQYEKDKPQVPLSIITKHSHPIRGLAINEANNILVSCSEDGTIIASSLRSGEFIKSVHFEEEPIYMSISKNAYILVNFYFDDRSILRVFDINLTLIGELSCSDLVSTFVIFESIDGSIFSFVSLRNKTSIIFSLPSFNAVWVSSIGFQASTMAYVEEKGNIIIGCEDGLIYSLLTQ